MRGINGKEAGRGRLEQTLLVAASTLLFSLFLVTYSLRDAGLKYEDELFATIDHAYRDNCFVLIAMLVVAAWIVRGVRWLRSQPPAEVPVEWRG